MSTPRLLLYTPTYGDAMRPETVAAVRAMLRQWHGSAEWEVGRANPWPIGDMRNVAGKYMQAREMALTGSYDALVTVEHDMAPPADALRLLWEAPGDVMYGVYLFRHGVRVLNALRLEGERNIGQSISLYERELRRARRAGVVRVSGVGWGCTLMRRSVLEAIPFRYAGPHDAGDLAFATDCLRAGVLMMAHFGCECLHYEGDRVWSPSAENNEMVPVEALADVTIAVGGQGVRLVAGQRYELPLEAALMHQRAGYLRLAVADDSRRATRPGAPLVEVLTRTNGRPTLLAMNQASLSEQTSDNWMQTILPDGQNRGIGWSYQNMAAHADRLTGEYIWILDDDDVCVRPTLVAEIEEIAGLYQPDVIMVRMDHGEQFGVLPGKRWGMAPQQGEIGVSAYIVRREIWQAHCGAMRSGHYASDYDFIEAIWRTEPRVHWHDVLAARAMQIGHGATESGVERAIDPAPAAAEKRTRKAKTL